MSLNVLPISYVVPQPPLGRWMVEFGAPCWGSWKVTSLNYNFWQHLPLNHHLCGVNHFEPDFRGIEPKFQISSFMSLPFPRSYSFWSAIQSPFKKKLPTYYQTVSKPSNSYVHMDGLIVFQISWFEAYQLAHVRVWWFCNDFFHCISLNLTTSQNHQFHRRGRFVVSPSSSGKGASSRSTWHWVYININTISITPFHTH